MAEEAVTKKVMVGRCNMTIIRRICLWSARKKNKNKNKKEKKKKRRRRKRYCSDINATKVS